MDRKLKKINCRINFHIENLSFELTGNKTDAQGNQKLISLGFENQNIQITKQEKIIKINMFGLTIGTYDKFEELYKFLMRTKYTVVSAQERVTSQIAEIDEVNDMKSAIDNQRLNVNVNRSTHIQGRNSYQMIDSGSVRSSNLRQTEYKRGGAANNQQAPSVQMLNQYQP